MDSMEATPKSYTTRRRVTYLLSALFTPALIVYLGSTKLPDNLIPVRPHQHGYNQYAYSIVLALILLINGMLVLITQWPLPSRQKVRIWLRSNLITIVSGIILYGLFLLIIFLVFSNRHWDFG